MSLVELALLRLYKDKPETEKAKILTLLLKHSSYKVFPHIKDMVKNLERTHDHMLILEDNIHRLNITRVKLVVSGDYATFEPRILDIRFWRNRFSIGYRHDIALYTTHSNVPIVPDLMSLDKFLDMIKTYLHPEEYQNLLKFYDKV